MKNCESTNLLNGLGSGGFSPRPPVVPPQINEILEHEADSAAHRLVGDDLVDFRKVVVEWRKILQRGKVRVRTWRIHNIEGL